MELTEAMERYLASLAMRSYSARSVSTRRWFLKEFIAVAKGKGIMDVRDVTEEYLRSYLVELKRHESSRTGRSYSQSTIGGFSVTLSVFFEDLARRGEILFDVARNLPRKKHRAAPGGSLTQIEAERILSQPDVSAPEGLRDRAILETLYSTAIRRAELASLWIEDIRFETGTLHVRNGKGRRDRIVPIGERALRWIEQYISQSRPVLRSRGNGDDNHLFIATRGENITPHGVTKITARHVRKSGIRKGSCHIFRHTCATEMLSNGADIIHVQEMLGHASVQTSELYTHVSAGRLKEKYTKSHPAAFGEIEETQSHAPAPKFVARYYRVHLSREKSENVIRSGIDRAIVSYLEHRQLELAETSLDTFGRSLFRFSRWSEDRGVCEVSQIDVALLESYQSSLAKRKKATGGTISIKTQKLEMEVVCSFVRWNHARGNLLYDPSARIVLPRAGMSFVAEILTREEVERVLSLPDPSSPYGIRDRSILEILYASGVRASELLRLQTGDANYERDTLRVTASKHGRDRVIPIGGRAMRWLYRYQSEARDEFVRDEDPGFLFLSNQGRPLSTVNLARRCRNYLTLAGIEKREAIHIFRHTCAAHMIENGADLRTVQEFLGHRSVNSTLIYTHLSIRKLKEVHANTHPAEKRFLERLRMTDDEREAIESEEAES